MAEPFLPSGLIVSGSAKMVIMSVNRREESLNELAEAIRRVDIPDAPAIVRASVEPYLDADGEQALKAMIVLAAPEEGGWSAEFTHALRRQVNRLAAERQINEHVYVTLFTEEEFAAREHTDEPLEDGSTSAIDQALGQDRQDRS
ncbi:hypothetical protein [Microtetraspora fusca]|uniref:Uncharacterized protein n=1 Tax=Microtetraspora fusca TaxID=1997 RepID=A0ABW6VEQ0_MICFU|nr:hypothetical protein [Microtetraspora fusca]